MTPPTVNAYYDPEMNEIVFPAGILQPPFFDPNADDASNYGAIGSVIGHEMTHGFDDEGRQFDAKGNLRDWWTPEDEKNFNERAACVEKQFDNYTVEDGLHENGKLVLGESIADLGGLNRLSRSPEDAGRHSIPRPSAGFTPDQRFLPGVRAICMPRMTGPNTSGSSRTPIRIRSRRFRAIAVAVQHAGFRAGIWLQRRRRDGPAIGDPLPDLVMRE